MGDLNCLETDRGKVVWHVNLPEAYKTKWPVWGYAAHPLVVRDKLITLAGGPGSAVVALDKKTGKEVWKALTTEEIAYAPPILVKAGGREQLIVWISESLSSLDPDSGKVFWSIPYPEDGKPQRPSVNIMAPRLSGDLLFVANFYHMPLVVKLSADKPDATVVWRGKSTNPLKPDGVNPVMNTPVVKDGYTYGITGMGELRCVDLRDGTTKWETLEAVGGTRDQFMTAFLVENHGRWFIFNEHGDLMIAKLSPAGFEKIDSAPIIKATMPARGPRDVVWCHPAFASRCLFVRNDEEMVCVSLAK
jgi:outer membrane protein assembly factor BamB